MNKDHITLVTPTTSQQIERVTLDGILEALDAWRGTRKKLNEKIPDFIWDQIFRLLDTMPESKILRTLSITRAQLNKKRQDRQIKPTDKDNVEPIAFCEVQKEPAIPLAYTPAKAFTTTTSVVEIRRPDGMLMKIHLCTDRFEELLSAFFKG